MLIHFLIKKIMEFNKEQLEVINELDKNILLLASAGTGKTNTLSYRIEKIIKEGRAKSDEILCITFTNKACKEMRERIEKDIKDSSKITIKTFHSFCFDIIKEEAKRNTDIYTDFIVYDEEDAREIIKSQNITDFSNEKIQSFIELVKLESSKIGVDLKEDKDGYIKVITSLFKYKEKEIDNICSYKSVIDKDLKMFLAKKGASTCRVYDFLLQNNHALDFQDLTLGAKRIIGKDEVKNRLKDRFKFINIDEVQDTSNLEYSIIEKLFENNNILLCGDMFQTIYSWRGSEPAKIIEGFKKKYYPKEIVLTKNYRSTKNITKASLGYLKNAFENEYEKIYKQDLECESKDNGSKINIAEKGSIRDEARYIYDEIVKMDINNENLSSIAILSRDNRYNIEISNAFREIKSYEGQNFDMILIDQYKFFRREEIKNIIAFFKIIANKNDSISLKRIIDKFPNGIGEKKLEAIESNEYKKSKIYLSDFIDESVYEFGEKYSKLINEYKNNNIVVFDVESTGIDVTEDEIIQIAAIKIDNKGKVIEKFERFLKPNKSVGSSEKVHGFSDEKLRGIGEDKVIVLKDFSGFIKGSLIVGHNVNYDISILESELSRNKLPLVDIEYYDTLDIYRRFHSNLINHKLETLANKFETENKPSHDAMDDILATKDLLVLTLEKEIIPTSLERISKMGKYLPVFNNLKEAINWLIIESKDKRPHEILDLIIDRFKLYSLYTSTNEEDIEKVNRIKDFKKFLMEIDIKDKGPKDAIIDILKLTSLSNGELENIIVKRTNINRIPIITVHQAKGLEYKTVFLVGASDTVFPSYMAIKNNNLEEEKRTFYVAITRAKENLYITRSKTGLYNKRQEESRFIKYLDKEYLNYINN